MFLNLIEYFATVIVMVFIKKILADKSLASYGNNEVKIKYFLGNQKLKSVIICIISFLLSLACLLFFCYHPEKIIIPNWIFAIICGFVGSRFISIIFDDLIIPKGLYSNRIILDDVILNYNEIISFSNSNDSKGCLIKFFIKRKENDKSFYIGREDLDKFIKLMNDKQISERE